jgi:DNA ligase-1
MKRFAELFAALDGTTATNAKVEAIAGYLADADPRDAAWAIFFLTGRRLTRLLPGRTVRTLVTSTGVSDWLMSECHAVVGDGAETAALILDSLPAAPGAELSLAAWVEDRVLPLRQMRPERQPPALLSWMRELRRWERFTLLKILTGEFRAGVSQTLVVRAIATTSLLPPATVAARLAGDWTPTADWYASLVSAGESDADRGRPYPFYLASPLDQDVSRAEELRERLGDRAGWQVEWKWDGIRAQLVKRDEQVRLWSRGDETIADRFPEIVEAAAALPDGVVLDGEILAFREGAPLPFAALQQRIGRRRDVARTARGIPVVFMAYDVLEYDGIDVREQPLSARRAHLDSVIAVIPPRARSSPSGDAAGRLPFDEPAEDMPGAPADDAVIRASVRLESRDWETLNDWRLASRAHGVEGLMLKRLDSPYGVGRKRGDWWKWKITPHTVDAVLIYAQPGSGKRASLLTDYTFGLWDGSELVPVAKAYSGLSNEEIAELDRWIRRHTVQRFGPVRHVEPVRVFELGFEAVAGSTRHRSGIAVRFPRILRWRRDKSAAEADTLELLTSMIAKG